MAKKEQIKQPKTKKYLARQEKEARQTRIIIIITIAIGTIILGLLAYGIIDQLIVKPRRTVASVGDTNITVKEFQTRVKYQRIQSLDQIYQFYVYYLQFGEFGENFLQTAQSLAMQISQPVSFGRDVLDNMIDGVLIREEAERRGITVSEEEIDKALQAAFNFFPEGTPTPTQTATIAATPTLSETQRALITSTSTPTEQLSEPTEISTSESEETELEDLESELEEFETAFGEEPMIPEPIDEEPTPELSPTITLTPTLYTTQVFGENIKEFESVYRTYGVDLDDFREIIEIDLLREKLIEDLAQDLEPFEEQVWARHILVETEQEALNVLALLDEGEDFSDLAAQYSTDSSNNEQGGDLGWFNRNTMVDEFTEAAFSLETGEISEPVETEFGFHIIQVVGQRENPLTAQDFQQKKLRFFNDWLSESRTTREDIFIYEIWEDYVPETPAIPQDLLFQLFQQ